MKRLSIVLALVACSSPSAPVRPCHDTETTEVWPPPLPGYPEIIIHLTERDTLCRQADGHIRG